MRRICTSASILVLLSTTASAGLVQFDNAALAFRWTTHVTGVSAGNYLDITLDSGQSGASTSRAVRLEEFSLQTSTSITSGDLIGNADASIAQSANWFHVQIGPNGQDYLAAKAFAAGGVIGPGDDWQGYSSISARGFSQRWYFMGDAATLGVRLSLGGQTHFGFITIAKVPDTAGQNYEYQPIGWGYESAANTPVVVPSPGAACLLGLGGMAMVRRRR
jgi:hypothetical protein